MSYEKKDKELDLLEPLRLSEINPAVIIFYIIVVPSLIALWLNLFIHNIPIITLVISFTIGGVLLLIIRSVLRYLKSKKH